MQLYLRGSRRRGRPHKVFIFFVRITVRRVLSGVFHCIVCLGFNTFLLVIKTFKTKADIIDTVYFFPQPQNVMIHLITLLYNILFLY